MHAIRWWAFLGILLLAQVAWSLDIPPLTGRVVDNAHILSPPTLNQLTALLEQHESRTSNQVALLTLPSLEGHPLEEFSHLVASAWALGKKGTDNGVLLLVAIQERKIRIEVGYGLEGTLTDAKSSQIIRHEIVPRFRQEDYAGGIVAGIQAILGTIDGTYTNTTPPPPESLGLWEIFGLAVLLGTVVGLFFGSRRRLNGSIIGMLLSFVVAFPAALWLGLLAGVVTSLLISLFHTVGGPLSKTPLMHDPGWGWSGHSWPIGGSKGFGGGGFGGGFSGGGGSFGGGGASGSW
jgi:uncharacterized protein